MHEIKMPQLGQSVEEASIVTWFKEEGDAVDAGEPLFSVQTDKAEIECESTAKGVLRKKLLDLDVEVPVLTVVALVGDADEDLPDLAQYEIDGGNAAPEAEPVASAPTGEGAGPTGSGTASSSAGGSGATHQTVAAGAVSPRAKAAAERLVVDPRFASPTGAGGRIISADVEAYATAVDAIKPTSTARKAALIAGVDLTRVTGTGSGGKITKEDVANSQPHTPAAAASGESQVIPLSPMRKIIADRMVDSLFTAPHYYVTVEVDMAGAKALREASEGFKPSFNDLVLKATALAAQEYPAVNSRWLGDAIEQVGDINLGFAVAMEAGLIVPVIKQIQHKSLQQINQEAKVLAEKARTGKLVPDDYSGNTLTISNLGVFGVDHFTAIINQPDSAIIAVGQIKERPVVVDGGIHIRPIMKMTLSSDHRVIDGALAAQFMGYLKDILEKAEF
jgi:pyruvate dehydrogenase E2 component (dihydrolipoamide acetyltransferase)